MTAVIPGQLDMLAEIEAEDREAMLRRPARCIYQSPARGLATRAAELEAWVAEYHNFNSLARSHAWRPQFGSPESPAKRCQPTTLVADTRPPHGSPPPDCACDTDALMYRGACRNPACNWESPAAVRDENLAAEDACGHAWPGWWDLPVMDSKPYGKEADWLKEAKRRYPAGWIEAGGPIRTTRTPGATRHHYAPEWGGFDLGVIAKTGGRP